MKVSLLLPSLFYEEMNKKKKKGQDVKKSYMLSLFISV